MGVAESGQLARVFIRRGDPGRVMTDCGERSLQISRRRPGSTERVQVLSSFSDVGTRGFGALPVRLVHPSYLGYDPVLFDCLVLWVIITVTYSLATAVRTELVEVRTFEVRQAHHERVRKRHRICARQH